MKQFDCVKFRNDRLKQLQKKVALLKTKPSLLIIQVGDNPASNKYVNNKIKRCEEVGIDCTLKKFPETITENDLINKITISQHYYSSIIVQEPLPKHIDSKKVNSVIYQYKDCDGLVKSNIGCLHNQQNCITPATPQGIINLFDYYNINLEGKNVLIVGRSNLVGRPLAELFLQKDCTVTISHSKTKDLQRDLSSGNYDIVVGCIGKAKLLKNVNTKYIIDVGINFIDGKMCGDFDIETCNCEWYTPVPNGVGQLTVATVAENIVKCHELQN